MKKKIPIGTNDILGYEMQIREHIIGIIKKTLVNHGFMPQHTPAIEHEETFNGHHGEGEKIMFRLKDLNNIPLVLRYDLTVPLARVICRYPEILMPYKRYQISPVWRDDKIDKGHFREFYQCDGDIVGTKSPMADADIIMLSYRGLNSLGFSNFIIRINHRMIIEGIVEKYGAFNKECALKLQRSLDAIDKEVKGKREKIYQNLKKKEINKSVIQIVLKIMEMSGDIDSILKKIKIILNNTVAIEGISNLQEILSYIPQKVKKYLDFDISLARGADYYTGFILEGIIPNVAVGAVLGGGRYDNLIAALGGKSICAVGMSFGLDRITTALKDLKKINKKVIIPSKILIAGIETESHKLFKITELIRQHKINVDLYYNAHNEKNNIIKYACQKQCLGIILFHKNNIYFFIFCYFFIFLLTIE